MGLGRRWDEGGTSTHSWKEMEALRLSSSKSGLAGILVIALVASTLLVLSLRRQEVGSPVYLARNEYPDIFKRTEARGEPMVFNFGVICKEPFKELEVRYGNMYMTQVPEFKDPNFVPNSSDPLTIMEARTDVQNIKANLGNVSIPFDVINVSVKIGNLTHSKMYRGVVYDFARTLALFLDKRVIGQIFEVFAVLKSDDGDLLYFSGVPDFFYDRSTNIKYLSIHHNQNETTYQAETELPIEVVPVDAAPPAGELVFRDTRRDDQIFIQMNVESNINTLPMWIQQPGLMEYLIEFVRVYANGRLEVSELNVIPFEKEGWRG